MERFYFLHCLWFAVFGCFAEQNLFLSEEDGAASDPFSVSAADTSLLYMPELTANDDLSNFIEFQDDGSLPWDPFTLSTTIDGDNDSESSIFAEASNEHCSFETGLLSPGLEARDDGGATRCDNPAAAGSIDSITPNGEEPLSGAASMGIKVDSRVAPYVNLETMRLKQICPPTPNDARKILPICSSPFRKDTRWYPLDGSYDLSMCTPSKRGLASFIFLESQEGLLSVVFSGFLTDHIELKISSER